jgi:hypothetical protein
MADDVTASNTYVETELTVRLKAVSAATKTDVLAMICPITMPLDDIIRNAVEDYKAKSKTKNDNVFVIIETEGGSIETAERIADLLRYHWKGEVSFIIPNFAMSAGTILVMSGDHIYMDYYSILGPIDPQVRRAGTGKWVPALGYLDKYKALIDSSNKGTLSAAELTFLIEKFDPAELHQFEQARDLSIDLLKKWLVKYKFKNWKKTGTKKKTVTLAMKEQRASEIAKLLNETKKWKTHGRGLSIEVVRKELFLVVEDFGANAALNKAVRSYYRLLQDYMMRRDHQLVIQTPENYFAV